MELYEVRLEIYHNNQLTQQQTLTAPKEMIIVQFLNLVEQIKNSHEKFKIKLIRPELIWIPWDRKQTILENVIEIQNYEE